MKLTIIFLLTFYTTFTYCHLNEFFKQINDGFLKFNQIAAEIAWQSSLYPETPELPTKAANYQKQMIKWQQNVCEKLATLDGQRMNNTQRRQTYLLCRGAKYTFEEAREISSLYEELQSTYSEAKICIDSPTTTQTSNLQAVETAILFYLTTVDELLPLNSNDSVAIAAKFAASKRARTDKANLLCLNGEEDLEKMMKYSTNEKVLRWLWLVWREKVGPPMREPYKKLVEIENRGARRNGYLDIGEAWRDELEIPDLRRLSRQLYEDIRPLYSMLHGLVRFHLRRRYEDVVPEYGPIPAHLLGDLWSQNWESLVSLIIPRTIDLNQSIQSQNWTVKHMLKRAEDFYQSLGLPPMTDAFWSQSVFERKNNKTRCHGTAADMFQNGDYRLLYCSGVTSEDMYVIHHEMGHIQYYMAYEKQPAIFRTANSALHETIGDSIMYGVMTQQHLHRLGLVNDSVLYHADDATLVDDDNDAPNSVDDYNADDLSDDDEISTDNILILKQALNKLPQIPFALLIDEYRWKYFEGRLGDAANQEFWRMSIELQGVGPPEKRGEDYFDVGAKFHVPDNTPYIRYFLSSFLQHQLFETLCKAAVFGRRGVTEALPPTITTNRCDIYGSKTAGKILKDLMSRGHSQHWREILLTTTGSDVISAAPLKRYYRPLYKLLKRLIRKYRIPIGW